MSLSTATTLVFFLFVNSFFYFDILGPRKAPQGPDEPQRNSGNYSARKFEGNQVGKIVTFLNSCKLR